MEENEIIYEKKELLTKEEKNLIKEMVKNINSFSCNKVKEIYLYEISGILIVRFFNENFSISDISTTFELEKLERNKRYTLKELGLEEK